ncbi:hypothetical protein CYD53_12650 [Bosea psychrotolerans]|uniref:Uncharacterized protein n=1 Tax=Bosea psychrotolerans TaxID=1871628 RepID=A0A2S4LV07_9HYPH|nr:hypothetical protein CYD53_12650 [Bosea psychrotolerans]
MATTRPPPNSPSKLGQPVSFTVDALRHQAPTGHIQDFSPATGSEFRVLKADNATGNFTKIVLRLEAFLPCSRPARHNCDYR